MSDDAPTFLRDLLEDMRDRQAETLQEVKEARAEVGELRLEVRTTTASDADCMARAVAERTERAKSLDRVWGEDGFKGVRAQIAEEAVRIDGELGGLKVRVGQLEGVEREELGERRVTGKFVAWVAGILAAAISAGLGWLAG